MESIKDDRVLNEEIKWGFKLQKGNKREIYNRNWFFFLIGNKIYNFKRWFFFLHGFDSRILGKITSSMPKVY